jgi:cation transport ATPase
VIGQNLGRAFIIVFCGIVLIGLTILSPPIGLLAWAAVGALAVIAAIRVRKDDKNSN